MNINAIDNLRCFTLKEYPNSQFLISSSLNQSRIFIDFPNQFIRLNKKIQIKEIS